MKLKQIFILSLLMLGLFKSEMIAPTDKVSQTPKNQRLLLEDQYIKTRNHYLKLFENNADRIPGEKEALKDLEQQLQLIIGPIHIKSFPNQGVINQEKLQPDSNVFYVNLDSLIFQSNSGTLVVTTQSLLKRYLTDEKKPYHLKNISKSAGFYQSVLLGTYAAVTFYTEIPVKKTSSQGFAFAFLGLIAQNVGPFQPNYIFIFVVKNDYIYMISLPESIKMPEFASCENIWDEFDKKRSEASHIFRVSEFKDTNAFDNYQKYALQGASAFRQCYAKEIQKHPAFSAAIKKAQAMIDEI